MYVGITSNMKRRQLEHKKGLSRTTNRFNKMGYVYQIRYKEIKDIKYEKTFKKYSQSKKFKISFNWDRWEG